MKKLDIYLQNVRILKALQYIKKGDCILDIGSDVGVMFEKFQGIMGTSVGIDPRLTKVVQAKNYMLIPGYFPNVCPEGVTYDVITMLAVLEHIPTDSQKALAHNCAKYLNKGGRVVITVPSPPVDLILKILTTLKILDGLDIHQHYGFKPKDTLKLFSSNDFKLLHRKTFQFGLNNLFVFEKIT